MQVRFHEAAVAYVPFAVAFEFYDIFTAVLSKADNDAMVGPAFRKRVLNDNRLTRVENGKLVSAAVWILVKANLAESAFYFGSKSWFVVLNWGGQTISNITAEEKLSGRIAGRLAGCIVVEQNRLGPFVRVHGFQLTVVGAVNESFHLLHTIFCDAIGLTVVWRRWGAVDIVSGTHESEFGFRSELGTAVAVDGLRDAEVAEDDEKLVDDVLAGGVFAHVESDGPARELVDNDEPLFAGVGSEIKVNRLKGVRHGCVWL